MQLKMGGKLHLKLNTGGRPIANKYREGKMKSTLKRELKGPEIVSREAIETNDRLWEFRLDSGGLASGIHTFAGGASRKKPPLRGHGDHSGCTFPAG